MIFLLEYLFTISVSVWMGEGLARLITLSHHPHSWVLILTVFVASSVYAFCRWVVTSGSYYWPWAITTMTAMILGTTVGLCLYGSPWFALVGNLALVATRGKYMRMNSK